MNRREFLKNVAKISAGACCAAAFGPLGAKFAHAQSMGGSGKSMVMFNLFGGADPLNSWSVPYNVAAYFDRRPGIAIPAGNVLTLNGTSAAGMHPSFTNFQRMYNDGDVALILGCGDPRGTRSHFTSQDIMSRGTTEKIPVDKRGWLGRLGDLYFGELKLNTLSIGVGNRTDVISDRFTNTPLAISSLNSATLNPVGSAGLSYNNERAFSKDMVTDFVNANQSNRNSVARAVDSARAVLRDADTEFSAAQTAHNPPGAYPAGAAASYLEQAATLIKYGLGTQVFYGGQGGWDDHSTLDTRIDARLPGIDAAFAAFEADLKASGKWDDTVVCIYTEFGRNTFENSSGGTDHGWGSTMILVGGGVNGGIYGGEYTDDEIRTKSWLYQDVDFRNPWSELISWLGYNPDPVFTEDYTKQSLGLMA